MPRSLHRAVRRHVLVGLVLTLTLTQAQPTFAEPCVLPDVSMPVLREALQRLTLPPRVVAPPEPSRWRGLLPTRMYVLLRGGQRAGNYTNEIGPPLERDVYLVDQGLSLRFDWDLRPLWAPAHAPRQPSADVYLSHAVHAEELAARVARQLKELRKAQGLAQMAVDGDPVCQDARADAEAALLVLESVVASARR